MNWSRRLVVTLLVAGYLAGATSQVQAEVPDDLTIIVPLGAGGALDKMARRTAQHLPNVGNFRVKVENWVIKGDSDGYQEFLERPADALTILAWFEPAASKYGAGFNYKDLSIINIQEIEPPILAARSDLGWRNMEDFVRAAREHPGKFRIGAGKAGGNLLLIMEQFRELGINVRQVDYASGGKARKGLFKGEIDITVGSLKSIKKLGTVALPLAVMAPRRLRLWAEVPSIDEAIRFSKASPKYGATYRFFAVSKEAAESHPERFARISNAMKELVVNSEPFRAAAGNDGRWFGSEDSLSLLSRASARYLESVSNMMTQMPE